MQPTDEVWLPVVGYEGYYEVSDQGRVRSVERTVWHSRGRGFWVTLPSKLRTLQVITHGPSSYWNVRLIKNGRGRNFYVHVLLLDAFVGTKLDGEVCRHLDGNSLNIALSNLAWGTSSENSHDQVAHGVHVQARKTHCPKGHPYDQSNTYYRTDRPGGGRQCRACQRARAAARARRSARG